MTRQQEIDERVAALRGEMAAYGIVPFGEVHNEAAAVLARCEKRMQMLEDASTPLRGASTAPQLHEASAAASTLVSRTLDAVQEEGARMHKLREDSLARIREAERNINLASLGECRLQAERSALCEFNKAVEAAQQQYSPPPTYKGLRTPLEAAVGDGASAHLLTPGGAPSPPFHSPGSPTQYITNMNHFYSPRSVVIDSGGACRSPARAEAAAAASPNGVSATDVDRRVHELLTQVRLKRTMARNATPYVAAAPPGDEPAPAPVMQTPAVPPAQLPAPHAAQGGGDGQSSEVGVPCSAVSQPSVQRARRPTAEPAAPPPAQLQSSASPGWSAAPSHVPEAEPHAMGTPHLNTVTPHPTPAHFTKDDAGGDRLEYALGASAPITDGEAGAPLDAAEVALEKTNATDPLDPRSGTEGVAPEPASTVPAATPQHPAPEAGDSVDGSARGDAMAMSRGGMSADDTAEGSRATSVGGASAKRASGRGSDVQDMPSVQGMSSVQGMPNLPIAKRASGRGSDVQDMPSVQGMSSVQGTPNLPIPARRGSLPASGHGVPAVDSVSGAESAGASLAPGPSALTGFGSRTASIECMQRATSAAPPPQTLAPQTLGSQPLLAMDCVGEAAPRAGPHAHASAAVLSTEIADADIGPMARAHSVPSGGGWRKRAEPVPSATPVGSHRPSPNVAPAGEPSALAPQRSGLRHASQLWTIARARSVADPASAAATMDLADQSAMSIQQSLQGAAPSQASQDTQQLEAVLDSLAAGSATQSTSSGFPHQSQ